MSKIARYQLANTAGYKFRITNINESVYDELAYYHKDNFPDLHITRPSINTDLSKLHNRALLSVNGFIHPTLYIDNNLYIPNATSAMLKSRQNNVGILSFNSLNSDINKIDITEEMISAEFPTAMYDKVILTFNKDILHPILIVCGYMIFEHPEFFYRVSSNSFALRLDRLNYIQKLYELSRYRNIFEELEVPISPHNPSVVDGVTVRSDLTIIKFLTSYNSFLVELPVTTFTQNKLYLEHSNIPGTFRTEIEPSLPFLGGYGKIVEYTKRKTNDTKYSVYTSDAYYNNHLFSRLHHEQINIYNSQTETGNNYRLSPGFFLELKMEE